MAVVVTCSMVISCKFHLALFFIKLTLVMHNCTQLSNLVPWISDVHLNLSHPDKLPRTSCFPFRTAPLASLSLFLFNGRNFPSTWEWIFHLKSEEKSLFVTAVVETVYNLRVIIKGSLYGKRPENVGGSFWALLIESILVSAVWPAPNCFHTNLKSRQLGWRCEVMKAIYAQLYRRFDPLRGA